MKIIDGRWNKEVEQLTPDEVSDDEDRRKLNEGDEGYEPIEGCRQEEVGWVKADPSMLIPTMYERFMDNGWWAYYVRPPKIVSV